MHYRAFLFIKFICWSASPLSEERERERQTTKENSHCPKERKCPRHSMGLGCLESNETSLSSIHSDTLITQLIFTQPRPPWNPRDRHYPGKEENSQYSVSLLYQLQPPDSTLSLRCRSRCCWPRSSTPQRHTSTCTCTHYVHTRTLHSFISTCVLDGWQEHRPSPSPPMATDSTPFPNQTSHTHATNHKQDLTLSYAEDKHMTMSRKPTIFLRAPCKGL